MYPQDIGSRRLAQLAKALKRRPQPVAGWINLTVRSAGHQRTSGADEELFNTALPNIRIRWTDERSFSLRVGVPDGLLRPRVERGELPAGPISGAVDAGRMFLVALMISSQGVFTWRSISTTPHGTTVDLPGEENSMEVEIEPRGLEINGAPPVHAGYLTGAVDIGVAFLDRGWAPRFWALYMRGVELLAAGGDFLGTYFEEAYLCFYRCLEHTVMVKILDRAGQYNDRHFEDAVRHIGAAPDDPKAPKRFARSLVQTRGTAVAHFLKKSQDAHVDVADVWAVKDAVDVLVSEYVKFLARRRSGRHST